MYSPKELRKRQRAARAKAVKKSAKKAAR